MKQRHSQIKVMPAEVYVMWCLFVALLVMYFCCKKRPQSNSLDIESTLQPSHLVITMPRTVKEDKPPAYNEIASSIDPPTFMESLVIERIQPELNKKWAKKIITRTTRRASI